MGPILPLSLSTATFNLKKKMILIFGVEQEVIDTSRDVVHFLYLSGIQFVGRSVYIVLQFIV